MISSKNNLTKIVVIVLLSVLMSNNILATVFTVSVNDGGWPAGGGAGTLNKAISDFNAAGAGAHTININVNVSLTNPAFWIIDNGVASLTINGNGNTVDGPGYSAWSITVNQLIINDWTMTSGFGAGSITLAGAGGHTFNNVTLTNVAFNFTTNNNSFTNFSLLGPGATYTTSFSNSSNNTITGCTFSQMALNFSSSNNNTINNSNFLGVGGVRNVSFSNNQLNTISNCLFSEIALIFTTSITNSISNSRFDRSGLSFLSGSNNNAVYGSKFNTNVAGTTRIANGFATDILINASTGNIIGANTALNRNIFALSCTNAISVISNSNNTQIVGNYFGTDVNGTTSLSGSGTNSTISFNASQDGIVDYNVISSMQGTSGGAIEVVGGVCSGLKIRYNKIGVDANGTGGAVFGNGNYGIILTGGTVNNLDIIGNTIARSVSSGVRSYASANPINIQDNFIGSNSTGLYDGIDYGNGYGGIVFSGGTLANVTITNNVIVRNGWVVQDNNSCGIYVNTSVNPISITNNKIGVYADYSGAAPGGNYSGNAFAGILFISSSSNITISGNVIGRNGQGSTKSHGIATQGTLSNITISNNHIGVTPASVAIGNGQSGIDLQGTTTASISGNYIGANEGKRPDIPAAGLALSNSTNQITVSGNYFGVMPNGTAAGQQLNGSYDGSGVRAEGTANRISLNNNDIAYNTGNGVNVVAGADYVQIYDNRIYCNSAKGINLNCGGSFPNGPGNSSFGCGTMTLNVFTPIPSVVNGGRPTNSVVYVYGTNACAAAACGPNPQGQTRFTAAITTYPTASTWDYNNGSLMYNDITALALGTGANCNGAPYCRTSEFSNCIDNTLPVSMLYFNVTAESNNIAQLTWATSSEKNSAYFIVEKSTDGIQFDAFAFVESKGNGDGENAYVYMDNTITSSIVYYRLKQVDKDGTYNYSEIKTLKFNFERRVSLYPNPNNGNFVLFVLGYEDYEAEIFSLVGQKLYYSFVEGSLAQENKIETNLSAGTYFLKIFSENGTKIQKFEVR